MFRYVALAGAILVSFTSCLSKTNTSSTIGDALLNSGGSYIVHGNCYSSNGSVTVSDGTGSIEAKGRMNCNGEYGEIHIIRQGNSSRVVRFKPVKEVSSRYRILRFESKEYAIIDKNGTEETVRVIGRGWTNWVVETPDGYERL